MSEMVGLKETRGSVELIRKGRLRPFFMTLIGVAYGVLLLIVSGWWDWFEGWLLAAIFLAYLVGTSLWVVRHAPGLSNERARAVSQPGSLLERLILIWVTVAQVVLIVVAALDGGRFQWSQVPIWVEVAGLVLMVGYITLNLWVMVHNAYLSAVVRVQSERGHNVVATRSLPHHTPSYVPRHVSDVGRCPTGSGFVVVADPWRFDHLHIHTPDPSGGSIPGTEPARLFRLRATDALPSVPGCVVNGVTTL